MNWLMLGFLLFTLAGYDTDWAGTDPGTTETVMTGDVETVQYGGTGLPPRPTSAGSATVQYGGTGLPPR